MRIAAFSRINRYTAIEHTKSHQAFIDVKRCSYDTKTIFTQLYHLTGCNISELLRITATVDRPHPIPVEPLYIETEPAVLQDFRAPVIRIEGFHYPRSE